MTGLADDVLPLIRTRADLHRYRTATDHGAQMHQAVDLLEAASGREDPAVVLTVTEKAIASALRVIMRADDSAGVIGDACNRLLELHPVMAARADAAPARLVDWMIRFQFDEECDFFALEPASYAPALGEVGMARYRRRLEEIRSGLGPEPSGNRWGSRHGHEWFVLEWNAKRLAVHDRDADAVIRTHVRGGAVPAWFHETAEALEEIGEHARAIEYARRASEHPSGGHQAMRAADYWCGLLEVHAPRDVLAARLAVFERWPSSSSATMLRRAAGRRWPDLVQSVLLRLEDRPDDAVLFALLELEDVRLAWDLAARLGPTGHDTWSRLAEAYESADLGAAMVVHERLVRRDLEQAGAQQYRMAARRLKRMRKTAGGVGVVEEVGEGVDRLVLELREEHRRRPRLQLEFDRAGLPRAD